MNLPPGQESRADMPAFGLPWYAHRMPPAGAPVAITVGGLVDRPFVLTAGDLEALPRRRQTSGLHCVTRWSRTDARWEGTGFRDVYEQLLLPRALSDRRIQRVRFRGADGYQDDLPIEDLLAPDVLLADHLDCAGVPAGGSATWPHAEEPGRGPASSVASPQARESSSTIGARSCGVAP